jgi:hypothetical protein
VKRIERTVRQERGRLGLRVGKQRQHFQVTADRGCRRELAQTRRAARENRPMIGESDARDRTLRKGFNLTRL